MKHISFAKKSLLVDDEAADCLLEYAARLAHEDDVDTVTLRAISPDGNTTEASLLLNTNSDLLIESTNSEVEPPDNPAALSYMRERMERMAHPPNAQTEPARVEEDRGVGGDA